MKTTNQVQKWLFPASEKIKTYLTEKFGENYRCEFQDICEYTAYENYTAWKGEPKNQEHFCIQFVIYKPTQGTSSPCLIKVYHENYSETMQYQVNK